MDRVKNKTVFHSELMDYKDCRRTLQEIIERTHNQTEYNKWRRSIRKLNTPGIDMNNQISETASMMDMTLTYLFYKQHNKVIEVGIDNNEHMVLEEWVYQIEETDFTRTEIVLHTRVIWTTSEDEIMDHG